MRAAVLRQGHIVVDNVADVVPPAMHSLVKTIACGICGSDLHFVHHGGRMVELSRQAGGRSTLDVNKDIVMGHEFVGEVVEHGPHTTGPAPGTVVVAMPVVFPEMPPSAETAAGVGYSNEFNGGYAEYMRLFTPLLLPVPNGLPAREAALTEPMAVGLHAVAKANLVAGDTAVVHGCGPVGLAVIAALRLRGVDTIVAADFSPTRRALAATMGAHIVTDPGIDDVMDVWLRTASNRPLVQFDAIGVPGILNRAMMRAPKGSRIVVVGVCMEPDTITPIWGINKELNLQFVLGYTPDEFAETLGHLAEGRIDGASLITGSVGLDGVAQAFADLANPDQHVKILVEPQISSKSPRIS
jgi:threonine dehydrogenase-like Zn-dependent dehydrogenase